MVKKIHNLPILALLSALLNINFSEGRRGTQILSYARKGQACYIAIKPILYSTKVKLFDIRRIFFNPGHKTFWIRPWTFSLSNPNSEKV